MSIIFKEVKDFNIRKVFSKEKITIPFSELYSMKTVDLPRQYIESFNEYLTFVDDDLRVQEQNKIKEFLTFFGLGTNRARGLFLPKQHLNFRKFQFLDTVNQTYNALPYFIEFTDSSGVLLAFASPDRGYSLFNALALTNPEFFSQLKVFFPFHMRYHPLFRNIIVNQATTNKHFVFEHTARSLKSDYPSYFIDGGFSMDYNGRDSFSRVRHFGELFRPEVGSQRTNWTLNFWIKIPESQSDLRGSYNTILEQWSGEKKGYCISIGMYNDIAGEHKHKLFARAFNGYRGYFCWSLSPIPTNQWTMVSLVCKQEINNRVSLSLYINGEIQSSMHVSNIENIFNYSDLYLGAAIRKKKDSAVFSSDIIVGNSFVVLNSDNYPLSLIEEYYEIENNDLPEYVIDAVIDNDENVIGEKREFFLSQGGFFEGDFCNLSFFAGTESWTSQQFSWLSNTLENRFLGTISRDCSVFQLSNERIYQQFWSSRTIDVTIWTETERTRLEVITEVAKDEFVCSTNPTCIDPVSLTMNANIDSTFATQLGLYDSLGNLLVIAKLNHPVRLGQFHRSFIVSLDLYEQQ